MDLTGGHSVQWCPLVSNMIDWNKMQTSRVFYYGTGILLILLCACCSFLKTVVIINTGMSLQSPVYVQEKSFNMSGFRNIWHSNSQICVRTYISLFKQLDDHIIWPVMGAMLVLAVVERLKLLNLLHVNFSASPKIHEV